jgi:S-ribosylhomocysteine lyase
MDVTSFGINHDLLLRGIYVSRVDEIENGFVTTFDIRMKEPNREPVMDTSVMHTLEHLIAVYFRSNAQWADKTVYIGPMGCRTGMYFIFKGNLTPRDVLSAVTDSFEHVNNFEGEIPAAKPEMCGNYLDHNLKITQWESRKFVNEVLKNMKPENMEYPKMNYDKKD